MKASYPLLAISNLLLMVITAVVGLMVSGEESLFMRHMLLGVLTARWAKAYMRAVETFRGPDQRQMRCGFMGLGL